MAENGTQAALDEATLHEKLEQYGFSAKEVETYLTVVEHGSARVSTIAEDADVSPSYVYDICERLEEQGFVHLEDHRTPTLVRARSPEEVFENLKDDISSIAAAIEDRYEEGVDEESTFELVKSRATVIKRIERLIDAADSEVIFQCPVTVLREVSDALERAVVRGVVVLVVVADEGTDLSEFEFGDVAHAVRRGVDWTPTVLAVDQRYGLIASDPLLRWDHGDERGAVFDQDQLAPILVGSFLGNYWPMAEEIHVAPPPSLPKRYDRIRPAVFDATLARRADETVDISMRARPTCTEQGYERLDGTVVGVTQNMLDPIDSSFGFENALIVDLGDRTVSVGGVGAFAEDYEAASLTLRIA